MTVGEFLIHICLQESSNRLLFLYPASSGGLHRGAGAPVRRAEWEVHAPPRPRGGYLCRHPVQQWPDSGHLLGGRREGVHLAEQFRTVITHVPRASETAEGGGFPATATYREVFKTPCF